MELTTERAQKIINRAPAPDWTHYCTRNRQYFKRDGNTDRLFVWLSGTKVWSVPVVEKVRWLERRERLEEILILRQRVKELKQERDEALDAMHDFALDCKSMRRQQSEVAARAVERFADYFAVNYGEGEGFDRAIRHVKIKAREQANQLRKGEGDE